MRVIGYIRVSTDEQAKDGVSLKVQRGKIEAYCKLYDLTLVDVLVDDGQSGKNLRRVGIQTALGMLRQGFAAGLVVAKLDRLSRSVGDWDTLIDDYFGERAGKQLFSVGDSIDTRTAAGRLVLNVLMSVVQWEREAIAERTRDGMADLGATGRLRGEVPFGYDVGRTETVQTEKGTAKVLRRLVENEAEQAVIKQMRQWRTEERLGYRRIAQRLEEAGIKSKTGNSRWVHTVVARILNRAAAPALAG